MPNHIISRRLGNRREMFFGWISGSHVWGMLLCMCGHRYRIIISNTKYIFKWKIYHSCYFSKLSHSIICRIESLSNSMSFNISLVSLFKGCSWSFSAHFQLCFALDLACCFCNFHLIVKCLLLSLSKIVQKLSWIHIIKSSNCYLE